MSTIKADTVQNTSGGPVALTDQKAAKAWCAINMDSASVRDSFSTSSIVDNGAGDFSINFTNAMTNSNYAALNGQQAISGLDSWPSWNATVGGRTPTTTRHYLGGWDYAGSYHDVQYSYIGLLGDLA